jgi:hypothetical protein
MTCQPKQSTQHTTARIRHGMAFDLKNDVPMGALFANWLTILITNHNHSWQVVTKVRTCVSIAKRIITAITKTQSELINQYLVYISRLTNIVKLYTEATSLQQKNQQKLNRISIE